MSTNTETQIAGLIAWRISPLINVDQYRQVLEQVGDPANLLENPPEIAGLEILAQKLRLKALRNEARQTLLQWKEQGIDTLVFGEPDYPKELLNIADPPLLLTCRGQWNSERLSRPRLSIVGSRRADTDGVEIAHHFALTLAESGACIVSGLALGVDGAAHRGAISPRNIGETAAPTIAVCGNGLSQVYPRAHLPLAKEILENGGVLLSQFDPQEPPYPVNFLNRNRLIAALSVATLVIQASEKSGSLVTAKNALEYGRELFIVPGSIKDPRYVGSNRLLQHGAHLVTSPADLYEIMPELKLRKSAPASSIPSGSMGQGMAQETEWLLSLLVAEERISIDQLYEKCPDPEKFFEQLLLLELEGVVHRLPGNFIALTTAKRLEISNNAP